MAPTTKDRVLACFHGIATGDAVGKQTETLTRDDVLRWYPNGINGFEGPLGSTIPRYRGNKKREWRVGDPLLLRRRGDRSINRRPEAGRSLTRVVTRRIESSESEALSCGRRGRRPLPVFDLQARHALEFCSVVRDECQLASLGLPGDEHVIGTNRRPH